MADTYYSWSTFRVVDPNKPDDKPETVNPGDTVTATTLGVSKEDFDILIAEGSVRTAKWPIPEGVTGVSPIEYLRQKAAETAEKGLDAVVEELSEATQPPAPTT